LERDAEGLPHHLIGDQLSAAERTFMSSKKYLRGFDNDSGMTMLRIGSMNLMLHIIPLWDGIQEPQFFYTDTLSQAFDDEREYDVILMNPPFKGAVDKGDVHPDLPSDTTKSELLFLHLILRALDMGGRAAVIVPDGVLFGSSRAHVELRKRIIEENRLDGVVSMPSGVFKPYAGVSTAILFFTRGAQTKDIWFYDMAHDGFSLDDKRTKVDENDIPDILDCWKNRFNSDFQSARAKRISDLRHELTPLKAERLALYAEINRLTFENVIAGMGTSVRAEGDMVMGVRAERDMVTGVRAERRSAPTAAPTAAPTIADALADAQTRLAALQSKIANPQSELDRLTRQFWVTKEQVRKGGAALRPGEALRPNEPLRPNYDLSASRYRQVEADAAYHEQPSVTLERLARLESVMASEIEELKKLLK